MPFVLAFCVVANMVILGFCAFCVWHAYGIYLEEYQKRTAAEAALHDAELRGVRAGLAAAAKRIDPRCEILIAKIIRALDPAEVLKAAEGEQT